MKNVFLGLVLVSSAALADGFKCESLDSSLLVKVYNHTQPEAGTRNAAVMILSDANVGSGNKTIAKFDGESTLVNSGARYVANVDLRFADSNRAGEYLMGTRLGELKKIKLDVDFSYAEPVEAGTEVSAKIIATKRNGVVLTEEATCVRYLKN